MTKDEEQLVNRTALLKEIVKTEKSRDWKRAEALLRKPWFWPTYLPGNNHAWRSEDWHRKAYAITCYWQGCGI